MKIVDIADELFRESDSATDLSLPAISFWLTSNVGKLNTLLGLSIKVKNAEFVPELDEEQKSIYKLLFQLSYLDRQVKKNLGAAAYGSSIVEVKDGDRLTRKVNKNEIAKTYASTRREIREDLDGLVLLYKMNQAVPLEVSGVTENDVIGMDASLVSVNNYRNWYDLN